MTDPVVTIPKPANERRLRVGDEITNVTQYSQVFRDSRDPTRAAKFMVTAINADGTIDLTPVRR